MASTEADPLPRTERRPYRRFELSIGLEEALPEPAALNVSQHEVLYRRRSADRFGSICMEDLSTWLKYTCGLQARRVGDFNRQRRFVGSFGALHPSHVLLGSPDSSWVTYIPERHSLGRIQVDQEVAQRLRCRAEQCHPGDDGTLITLLADLDLAESYYVRPAPLLLRDGGVIFGHGSLVAAAIGIPFRILGIVGTGIVESLLPNLPFRCFGTGLAWIGGSAGTDLKRTGGMTAQNSCNEARAGPHSSPNQRI